MASPAATPAKFAGMAHALLESTNREITPSHYEVISARPCWGGEFRI
jgi:hypothetical protein